LFSRKNLIGASVALALAGGPAAAQSLSVDDPSFISLGAGAFDVLHDGTAGELRGEFRSGHKLLGFLKPFVGVSATTDGAVYGYFGPAVDIYFGRRIVLTGMTAVGAYHHGDGLDLGHWVEFRSGLELAYRFDGRSRFGVGFHHISNIGIGDENPGTEILGIFYAIPLGGEN
jgi:hypothetical protein